MNIKSIMTTVLVFAIFLPGCKKSSKTEIERSFGKLIQSDSVLTRAYPKFLVGDTLISSTYTDDANYCVSVFRNDSIITLGNAFFKGHGDGEYTNVALNVDKTSMSVLDMEMSSGHPIAYFKMPVSLALAKQRPYSTRIKKFPEMDALRFVNNSFVETKDGMLLIAGTTWQDPKHIMSLIDPATNKIIGIDYWPEDEYKGSPIPKTGIYTDNARIFRNGDKYLYKCGEERFAFIFTLKGEKLHLEKKLFDELPIYEEASDGLNYNLKKRSIRSMEVDANEHNIYVLLEEKTATGSEPANWVESGWGNQVMTFDWSGNLEQIIELDHFGTNIKVSFDNKKLYLFSDDVNTDEKKIFCYDL